VATPSPGSIFAYLAETPRGGYFGVLAGVIVSTAVSFAVAATLLGLGRGERLDEPSGDELAAAHQRTRQHKAESALGMRAP
jgi:PTS system mannitol-specific IIC component